VKGVIAILVGAFYAATVQAGTFVVEVSGVVQRAIGQSGGVLDAVQVGDAVTETFVFDTARFPVSTGDGATSLVYANSYVSPVDALRSRVTVGAVRFDVQGYPFAFEAATAFDSFVPATPVGVPPPPPSDRFAVSDISAAVALNVPDTRGLVRWAAFGALAPAASSMVPVPITSLANVNLAAATAFASQLIEGEAWVNPRLPSVSRSVA
jgi:hypothetical protein